MGICKYTVRLLYHVYMSLLVCVVEAVVEQLRALVQADIHGVVEGITVRAACCTKRYGLC